MGPVFVELGFCASGERVASALVMGIQEIRDTCGAFQVEGSTEFLLSWVFLHLMRGLSGGSARGCFVGVLKAAGCFLTLRARLLAPVQTPKLCGKCRILQIRFSNAENVTIFILHRTAYFP